MSSHENSRQNIPSTSFDDIVEGQFDGPISEWEERLRQRFPHIHLSSELAQLALREYKGFLNSHYDLDAYRRAILPEDGQIDLEKLTELDSAFFWAKERDSVLTLLYKKITQALTQLGEETHGVSFDDIVFNVNQEVIEEIKGRPIPEESKQDLIKLANEICLLYALESEEHFRMLKT